jgi:DNA polymerase-3 subunit beta
MSVEKKISVCLMQISRDELLYALKQVSGAVEQSQVMQILAYVLISGNGDTASILASNSEVEVETSARLFAPANQPFSITVSCKKLMDICRALPEGALIEFHQDAQWIVVRSTDAQFKMATLPSESFPRLPMLNEGVQLKVNEGDIKSAVERSCFSMAYQDARFFLNGMLLSSEKGKLNCVSTDGHRLSWCRFEGGQDTDIPLQAIVPRKTVLELVKLLRPVDHELNIFIGEQAIEIHAQHFKLKSNLIEGQYPKYKLLIPASVTDTANVDTKILKQALDKVAILANEKFKGARFSFENNSLSIVSSNFDQEEAVSSIPIEYSGKTRVVAFNISYVLEVLNVLKTENCLFQFSDKSKGVLVESTAEDSGSYVIMPLTL